VATRGQASLAGSRHRGRPKGGAKLDRTRAHGNFALLILRLSDLQPVFLRQRRHDAGHAQIFDDLAAVIGDMPHGDDGNAEFRVGPAYPALDAVERVLFIQRREDAVAVVE
jgi:hypothetical protein